MYTLYVCGQWLYACMEQKAQKTNMCIYIATSWTCLWVDQLDVLREEGGEVDEQGWRKEEEQASHQLSVLRYTSSSPDN